MKIYLCKTQFVAAGIMLLLTAQTSYAQGAAAAGGADGANPAQAAGARRGGGGGGLGGGGATGTPGLALPLEPFGLYVPGGRGQALTDLELTAITKAEEGFKTQLDAVANARDAVVAAAFTLPSNPANLTSKLQSLSNAELQNALAQADAYAKLLVEFKGATPGKLAAMTSALGNPGGGGGRGGGGGGGGAPRGGGGAGAPAPAQAAPRGN